MKQQDQNNCRIAIDSLLKELENESFTKEKLDMLCHQFPDCAENLQTTLAMWQQLEEVPSPEPSPAMDAGFYKMLSEFTTEQAKASKAWWDLDWVRLNGFNLKWVALAGVFMLGMASGVILWPEKQARGIADIEQNLNSDQAVDWVALTSAQSTTERLMSIQQIRERAELDDQIVQALGEVLMHDENENVRLSAIETMLYFADNPKVRENLIRAIPYQSSPLIQMTLAEVMVALNDSRAVNEIRQLLETQQLELEVKMKMEETIETLL